MPSPLIALVEDEEHLAQGLIFNLQAEGYRTHHESDGTAGLNWLLNTPDPPAALILDVMLPGQDGFSILRALRESGRYIPVLLLTARGRTEDIVEGFAAGADDYLAKPFDLTILLARLTSLLRRVHWSTSANSSSTASHPRSRTNPSNKPSSRSATAPSTSKAWKSADRPNRASPASRQAPEPCPPSTSP